MTALVSPEASKFLASHPSKLGLTRALGNATVSCLLRLGSYSLLNQRQLYNNGCTSIPPQDALMLLPLLRRTMMMGHHHLSPDQGAFNHNVPKEAGGRGI